MPSLTSLSTSTSITSSSLTSEKSSIEYPSLCDPSLIQNQTQKADREKKIQKEPQTNNTKQLETNLDSKCSISEPDISSESKTPGAESLITYSDWPKPDYTRSISENAVENLKIKPAKKSFFRTLSSDSGKKKHKENKDKKDKKSPKRKHLWLRIKNSRSKKSVNSSEVIHVEGHYKESPLKESTNLSPLKGWLLYNLNYRYVNM